MLVLEHAPEDEGVQAELLKAFAVDSAREACTMEVCVYACMRACVCACVCVCVCVCISVLQRATT